jgi:serine/threonine-protein kinase PpkA
MTERDWYNMNIGQQTEFIYQLKARVASYDEYDKDIDHWGKFGNDNPGDWLYRVPLNMLP